jgi:hypothetical protein
VKLTTHLHLGPRSLPQYAFMARRLVKEQGQLYLYFATKCIRRFFSELKKDSTWLEATQLHVTYLLTYLLTSWCRILFEKLIVTQLVKKYPAFLRNPKIHYRVHTRPPLDPILSQLNPVRPIDPCLPKIYLRTNSHVLFPLLRSCQRISPGPWGFETFRNNKKIFTVRGCFPHAQPPSWRITPYRLSATAYSVHSQLSSVPGRLPSIHNLRTHHAMVTRPPLTWRCVSHSPECHLPFIWDRAVALETSRPTTVAHSPNWNSYLSFHCPFAVRSALIPL